MYKLQNIDTRRPRELREVELLDKAREQFYKATELRLEIEQLEPMLEETGLDALARLVAHGLEIPLAVEIKTRPTKAIIGIVAQQFKGLPRRGLLVADYINSMMAERLKKLDIWFIDAIGNAYIHQPPVCIYIRGNRPTEKLEKDISVRAFQPTGLKVIFAFLCNLELLNAPYRNIAHVADVALGTVGWIMRDLKELGYLIETKKHGRYLIRKSWLLVHMSLMNLSGGKTQSFRY